MKWNIITVDIDVNGKRGYLQSGAMTGVYMILTSCYALGREGVFLGNLWFTRSNKE